MAEHLLKVFRESEKRGRAAFVGFVTAGYPSLDETVDERLMSPQQRRALMRARRGLASAPTGVFRGFADRVVELARHAASMGVPSAGLGRAQGHKLLANDDDEEPQETAPGTESDDEEQRRDAVVASGHGTAYAELARRIALASSSSVS